LRPEVQHFGIYAHCQCAEAGAPNGADPFVCLDAAGAAVARLVDADLVVRRGESRLGGFAQADEILRFLGAALQPVDV
jgi:hypothetical protein